DENEDGACRAPRASSPGALGPLAVVRGNVDVLERRDGVELREGLLVVVLLAPAVPGLGRLDDLEEDDGDVVLAPLLVGRVDERLAGPPQVVPLTLDAVEDRLVCEHRGQAVGAEHAQITGAGLT